MLTQKQKNEIIAEVLSLQNATVLTPEDLGKTDDYVFKQYSKLELQYVVENIEIIYESTLKWIDEAMYREMRDFTDVESRKKLGLEILDMIIKKRREDV